MLKLIVLSLLCYAHDNQIFVNFGLDYPLTHKAQVNEKTYIVYETPLSQVLEMDFNSIAIQGKISDKNVLFELWVPQNREELHEENSLNDVMYSIVKPSKYKVYKNGRFWIRFDLTERIKRFKFVVINNGIKGESFEIIIYEIIPVRIDKKKAEVGQEGEFVIEDPLPFKLIRRKEWKANPPLSKYIKHIPKRITIHNTAGNYPLNYEDALQEIQIIQDYHQQARGWIDIGYHFLIDPLGNIFEARPFFAVGAHVANKNVDNIGIAVMGNYHPPVNNVLTSQAVEAIVKLVRYIKDKYSIPKSEFYAHRDLAATDCPGDVIYQRIPEIRDSIFKESANISVEVRFSDSKLNEFILNSVNNW